MNKVRSIADYLMLTLRGMCMGAADVIPGVSGGTIAFLTGIYEELLNSIKSIDAKAIKYILSFKIVDFWKHINGNFLIAVFIGILISVFSLAKLMQYLLEFYPIPLWSFFFGLIIASAIYILKDVAKWKRMHFISLLVGIVIAAFISFVSPTETSNELWFIFISGMIAICAMILPGISGSFILLLMGKYAYIMDAITDFNIPILVVFALGAGIGIISFSHVLSWFLKKFYTDTICLLSGFMIGSLLKVWPWRYEIELGIDKPLLPTEYELITGQSSLVGEAVFFAIFGVLIVFVMEMITKRIKKTRIAS